MLSALLAIGESALGSLIAFVLLFYFDIDTWLHGLRIAHGRRLDSNKGG